jgi:hypothetical protein
MTDLRRAAQQILAAGRNGDTMLAHITPREAAMLKAAGGSGTVNPRTGLPEFFGADRGDREADAYGDRAAAGAAIGDAFNAGNEAIAGFGGWDGLNNAMSSPDYFGEGAYGGGWGGGLIGGPAPDLVGPATTGGILGDTPAGYEYAATAPAYEMPSMAQPPAEVFSRELAMGSGPAPMSNMSTIAGASAPLGSAFGPMGSTDVPGAQPPDQDRRDAMLDNAPRDWRGTDFTVNQDTTSRSTGRDPASNRSIASAGNELALGLDRRAQDMQRQEYAYDRQPAFANTAQAALAAPSPAFAGPAVAAPPSQVAQAVAPRQESLVEIVGRELGIGRAQAAQPAFAQPAVPAQPAPIEVSTVPAPAPPAAGPAPAPAAPAAPARAAPAEAPAAAPAARSPSMNERVAAVLGQTENRYAVDPLTRQAFDPVTGNRRFDPGMVQRGVDLAFGAVPVLGQLNALSGMFGGPSIGGIMSKGVPGAPDFSRSAFGASGGPESPAGGLSSAQSALAAPAPAAPAAAAPTPRNAIWDPLRKQWYTTTL